MKNTYKIGVYMKNAYSEMNTGEDGNVKKHLREELYMGEEKIVMGKGRVTEMYT